MKRGDIILIKTEKELIESGYSNEEIQERKQFVGKFAIVDSIITTISGGFFYLKNDKKFLKWFKDMISEGRVDCFTDRVKIYCNKYCVHECFNECPFRDIKDIFNE